MVSRPNEQHTPYPQQIIVRIHQLRECYTLAIETYNVPAGTSCIERLWEVSSDGTPCDVILRLVYGSLAHVERIDAIHFDHQHIVGDMNWRSILATCLSLPRINEYDTRSVVVSIDPTNLDAHRIESSIRQLATTHAQYGIRLNLVYRVEAEQSSLLSIVRYLLGGESRFITGSVIESTGKILLGGMLEAERLLAHRAIKNADHSLSMRQNSA